MDFKQGSAAKQTIFNFVFHELFEVHSKGENLRNIDCDMGRAMACTVFSYQISLLGNRFALPGNQCLASG